MSGNCVLSITPANHIIPVLLMIFFDPRPMWTHALSRDYDEMEKIMEVLPDDLMHVRHYQGHWYKNNDLLDSMEEKEAPLPREVMDKVRLSISSSRDKKSKKLIMLSIYEKAKNDASIHGVEWIVPVKRPKGYHSNTIKKLPELD